MDYNEKIAFLRRYRDAQRTMRRLLEELAQLRAEAASISAALSGMPSGGGDAQAAAFRLRSGAVRPEVLRRLQKPGELPGEG